MGRSKKPLEVEAKYGDKMIELTIRFWTDSIAEAEGKVRPKHAWAAGVVSMQANKSHGIAPIKPIPFHTLMDLPAVIEKVVMQAGIQLHPGRKMQKYVSDVGDD